MLTFCQHGKYKAFFPERGGGGGLLMQTSSKSELRQQKVIYSTMGQLF